MVYLLGWDNPSQDSCGKWRFRLGSPILKMVHVILVVTIASWEGGQPNIFTYIWLIFVVL